VQFFDFPSLGVPCKGAKSIRRPPLVIDGMDFPCIPAANLKNAGLNAAMTIIKLEGQDQRLYTMIARLVMDEEVLAYNLNYPFKTSPDFLWFIAADNDTVLGFMPVKMDQDKSKAKINNYYVADDDSLVFNALLEEITQELSHDYEIESITQIQHVPDFERNGFTVMLYWTRYAKMRIS
jgi:hypothetical protein